jgi:hypothetical protein
LRQARILKELVLGESHWLKARRCWSETRVKMTLTVVPEGLAVVILPLKGKISFLRNVVGRL